MDNETLDDSAAFNNVRKCIFCNRGPLFCKQSRTIQNLISFPQVAGTGGNDSNSWFSYFYSFFVSSENANALLLYFHPMCLPCKHCNRARLKQTNFDSSCDEKALNEYLAIIEKSSPEEATEEATEATIDYQYYELFDIRNVLIYGIRSDLCIRFTTCHALRKEDVVPQVPAKAFELHGLYLFLRNPIDGIVSQYELHDKCPSNGCNVRNVLVFIMEKEDSFHTMTNGSKDRFHLVDLKTRSHSSVDCKTKSKFLIEQKPTTKMIFLSTDSVLSGSSVVQLYESILESS